MDGFMRVSGGRYPCRGDRLALTSMNSLGIRRELGGPPVTRFKPIPGSLGRRLPVGSRSQEDHPAPDELCESEKSSFEWKPLTEHKITNIGVNTRTAVIIARY